MLRPDRELQRAWLLLFLAHGSGYGYGLAQQLREQRLDVEMTVVYRVLRGLERDRHVTSRWIESTVGPRRRLYSLTASGRRTLDGLVAVVAEHSDRYHDFVQAYAQAGHDRRTPQAPLLPSGDGVVHPEKELLTAWLLLLLDGDASYGHALRRRLYEHEVTSDPGGVYRRLRRLDADGRLRSHWSAPVLGPRRRLYELTANGGRDLHHLAAMITRTRDMHDAFIDAYARVDDDYRGPAITRRNPPPPTG